MGTGFVIRETAVTGFTEFIPLLEQTGQWLWDKGIKQWEPGSFVNNRSELEKLVANGRLILAYQADKLAGGCILTAKEDAMQLSALAVARFAAGQNVGPQIIDRCIQVTRQSGQKYLRLDCWEGNDFLKAYYRRAGFTMLEAVPEGDYYIRLFELDVQAAVG